MDDKNFLSMLQKMCSQIAKPSAYVTWIWIELINDSPTCVKYRSTQPSIGWYHTATPPLFIIHSISYPQSSNTKSSHIPLDLNSEYSPLYIITRSMIEGDQCKSSPRMSHMGKYIHYFWPKQTSNRHYLTYSSSPLPQNTIRAFEQATQQQRA
jgi:hypothetical protein